MQVTQIYYLHEIGSKKNQEDYLWPVPGAASAEDRIFIVCDGVGGSDSGEVASRIVAESVGTSLLRTSPADVRLELVNNFLEGARRKLVEYGASRGLSTDMATTFTLLQLIGDRAFIAWVGDSRVYHLRGSEVLYRTTDHSLVFSLIRNGELTEEEAHDHPQKNLLLKAVRADDTKPEADGHWIEDVREGDYFMLCTDGLLENITEPDLLFLLRQNDEGTIDVVKGFQQFCYEKTRDNYSMYLLKVGKEEEGEPADDAVASAASGSGVAADESGTGLSAAIDPAAFDSAVIQEEDDAPVVKRKTRKLVGWLVFLLLVLVAAAAFIIKENYFSPVKQVQILIPTVRAKDSSDQADSMLRDSAGLTGGEHGKPPVRRDTAVKNVDSIRLAMRRSVDSLRAVALVKRKDSMTIRQVKYHDSLTAPVQTIIPKAHKDSTAHTIQP